MTRKEHPAWEEELMAYVDGQLDSAQTSDIDAHLKGCQDCAAAVADARGLSQQMAVWTVEDPSQEMNTRVLAELRLRKNNKPSVWWNRHRAWTYGLSGAAALVLVAIAVMTVFDTGDDMRFASTMVVEDHPVQNAFGDQGQGQNQQSGQGEGGEIVVDKKKTRQYALAGTQAEGTQVLQGTPSGPMIIRSSRLTIVTTEFESARTRIEAVVQESQGYMDQLTARGAIGSGRTLSANLRVPSNRIDSVLSQLRKLGKVQEESQANSEITSQYVDLQARLMNARNTEQRLLALQRERTDKLIDVVQVEKEIGRVREEIERMTAQEKDMTNKVAFATIQVEMSEEYRAAIEPGVPSAGTQLRNALIDGYHGVLDSALGIALFALRYGPGLLFWSAVLLPVVLLVRHFYRVRLS